MLRVRFQLRSVVHVDVEVFLSGCAYDDRLLFRVVRDEPIYDPQGCFFLARRVWQYVIKQDIQILLAIEELRQRNDDEFFRVRYGRHPRSCYPSNV